MMAEMMETISRLKPPMPPTGRQGANPERRITKGQTLCSGPGLLNSDSASVNTLISLMLANAVSDDANGNRGALRR
jgi:hypothetical protein